MACFSRRRDISSYLVNQVDRLKVDGEIPSIKLTSTISFSSLPSPGPWDDEDEMTTDTTASGSMMNANSSQQPQQPQSDLTDTQKHQLRHRELFLTRQIETLLATNIRGKCLVTLHNETEAFLSYLNAEVCREQISRRRVIGLFKGSLLLSTRL